MSRRFARGTSRRLMVARRVPAPGSEAAKSDRWQGSGRVTPSAGTARASGGERGLGLLEVLVAIVVLAAVGFSTAYLLMSETGAVSGLRSRLEGASVASEVNSCLHASQTSSLLPPAVVGGSSPTYTGSQTISDSTISTTCPSAGVGTSVTTASSGYVVTATASLAAYKNGENVTEAISGATKPWSNECFGFPGSPIGMLQVQSQVQNRLASQNIGSDASMTTNQTSLIVPAQIDVKTMMGNSPDADEAVTLSGGGVSGSLGNPQDTGSQGCVSYLNLTPGTYTVTAGSSSSSATVTLSPGQVYSLVLDVPTAAGSTSSASSAPNLASLQAIPWMTSAWTPGETPIPEGPASGGNTLVVCGTNLFGTSGNAVTWEPESVSFSAGSTPEDATFTPVTSGSGCTGSESGDQELEVYAPAFASGTTVSITVSTTAGSGTLSNSYLYYGAPFIWSMGTPIVPCPAGTSGYCNTANPSGTPSGGTPIDILGFNFDQLQQPGSAVAFTTYPQGAGGSTGPMSGQPVDANFNVDSSTEITAASPVDDVSLSGLAACITSGLSTCVTDISQEVAYLDGSLVNYAVVQLVPGSSAESPSAVTAPDCPLETSVALDWSGTGNVPVTCHFEYGPTPTLTSLNPSEGSVLGGTQVAICGTNLSQIDAVEFGSHVLTHTPSNPGPGQFEIVTQSYNVLARPYYDNNTPCGEINAVYPKSVTYILAISPHGTGSVQVSASNPFGSSNSLTFSYSYIPSITSISPTGGPVGGGNTVTLTGGYFADGDTVNFGCATATISSVTGSGASMTATVTAPASSFLNPLGVCGNAAGLDEPVQQVGVTVTNPIGTSNSVTYTYANTPNITGLSVGGGSISGGTTVAICGSNLQYLTSASFGGSTVTPGSLQSVGALSLSGPCGGSVAGYQYVDVTTPSSPNGGYDQVGVTVTNIAGMTSNSYWSYTFANAPVISSISPPGGPVGGGTTVTIHGQYFQGVTSVNFGCAGGSIVSSNSAGTVMTVTSPASSFLTLGVCGNDLTLDEPVQQVTLTASNPAGSGSYNYFTYANTPSISSLNPANGRASGGNTIAICGSNLQYITSADFGGNVTTNVSEQSTGAFSSGPCGYTYTGYSYLDVVVPSSPTGGYDQVGVSITNAAGMTSNSLTYTYNPPPPTISSVYPHGGGEGGGTTVTIDGTNLDGAGFNTSVSFGCAGNASISSGSGTQLVVSSPDTYDDSIVSANACGNDYWNDNGEKPLQVTITVSTIGGSANSSPWTYQNSASLSGLSPSNGSAWGGNQVCVNGSNLEYATGVWFGSREVGVRYWTGSNSQICVDAPSNGGSYGQVGVWVQMPSGVGNSNSLTYTYNPPPPTISSVYPHGGGEGGGTTVTIDGTNLDGAGFNTSVSFGCAGNASIISSSGTQLVVSSPDTYDDSIVSANACGNDYWNDNGEKPLQVTITVSTIGGSANYSPWTYQNSASLSGLSPSSGTPGGGYQVCVNGSNLEYATGVWFGSREVGVRYWTRSNSQICVNAPSSPNGGNESVQVSVIMPSGVGNSNSETFTYIAPPSITGLNPSSFGETCDVHGNVSFTVSGSNFVNVSEVEIGGNSVGWPSGWSVNNSGTSITVNINATWTPSGQVTVVTPQGSATSSQSISWNNSCW